MGRVYVVTSSYPRSQGDPEGHFVGAEVRRLLGAHDVTVLAPGAGRASVWGERVVSLGGGEAFGFPGALERLKQRPAAALGAGAFCWNAVRWLQRAPAPNELVAHFLVPCAVPVATRGWRDHATTLEVVVHGSDARLFARAPAGHGWVANELLRTQARLRFVSTELSDLVLGRLELPQRAALERVARVEPCAIDVAAPARAAARRLLDIDESERVALIVARLVRAKRVEVALEACERVRGLRAIVVGDGPERERLCQRFGEARFVGQVERSVALSYVAAADVLVSASLEEGAPTVVREARALGTPVVCLPAGDVARWAERDAGIFVAS